MKLLIDMNISPAWLDFLRSAGIEATHWASVGQPDAPDTDIVAYAAANDYVILTHDLDFGAILAATNGAKPSVVQFRAGDLSPDTVGRHLIDALCRTEAELEQGALVTIEPARARIRLLPLRERFRPAIIVSWFGNSEVNFQDTSPLFSVACCSLKLVGISEAGH